MLYLSHLHTSPQNYVAVETGFLHSQKFTNSLYYFLITVESATFQVLCQRTKPMTYCILPPLEVVPLLKRSYKVGTSLTAHTISRNFDVHVSVHR